MIIALAGRRTDADGAKVARFPLGNAGKVSAEVKGKFETLKPAALVCSAACGADLIALTVARELGLRRRIVLPFPPRRFRETSVVDRPGDASWNWGELFDALIAEAEGAGDLVVLPPVDDEMAAYALTNERIVSEAIALSGEEAGGGENRGNIRAIILWEGSPRGDDDLTAEFAERARAEGISVEQVLTVARQEAGGG